MKKINGKTIFWLNPISRKTEEIKLVTYVMSKDEKKMINKLQSEGLF